MKWLFETLLSALNEQVEVSPSFDIPKILEGEEKREREMEHNGGLTSQINTMVWSGPGHGHYLPEFVPAGYWNTESGDRHQIKEL